MLQVRRGDGQVVTLPFEFFEEEVREGLIGPETLLRFRPVTGPDFVPAAQLELYRSVEDSPRTRFERSFTLRRIPRATLGFVVLLLLAFLWQLGQGGDFSAGGLVDQGAKSMAHQRELGEWWRLVTGSLLHSGWPHLIFNLLFLVHVGRNVEALLGPGGMILIVAIGGPGSMAASSWATDVPTVGASGVTFAFFGAAVALGWRFSTWMPRAARAKYGWPIVPFVGFFLVFGVLWPGIDNFCHFGGLLLGGLLGLVLPSPLERVRSDWKRLLRFEVALAAAVLGLLVMVLPLGWSLGLMPSPQVDWRESKLEEAGLRLKAPKDWPEIARSVPGAGWSSITGQGQLSVQTWVEELGVLRPADVRRRWRKELGDRAILLERDAPSVVSLGLSPGWIMFEADLVTDEERLRLLRVGWLRGSYLTTIDFLHPIDSWEIYADLRGEVLRSVVLTMPSAVVRAVHELLGDTLPLGGEVLPYLDVVASRPVSEPTEALRVAAELARVGDSERALRMLASLDTGSFLPGETAFWRLWVQHHIDGREDADGLARAKELVRLRPGSLLTMALGWSIADRAGDQEWAQQQLDEVARRWPRRAATLSERVVSDNDGR